MSEWDLCVKLLNFPVENKEEQKQNATGVPI